MPETLLDLCADAPLVSHPAGSLLIEEGAGPTAMYVLASGAVTVEREGTVFARIDHPGAVLGEMSVVLRRPATATVRAETDVELRVVDDPERFLTERPGAALLVLRLTAQRLDGLTQYLVDVKDQFAGLEGHLGMVGDILDALVNHQPATTSAGSARDPEGDHQH